MYVDFHNNLYIYIKLTMNRREIYIIEFMLCFISKKLDSQKTKDFFNMEFAFKYGI